MKQEHRRQNLRCALCHDDLSGVEPFACLDCDTLLHYECRTEIEGCPTLGCTGQGLTFAEMMERRDGRVARLSLAIGALVGAVLGLWLMPIQVADRPFVWNALASCIQGAMSGFLMGPLVGFGLRATVGRQEDFVQGIPCPRCEADLYLNGTFCKACGWEQGNPQPDQVR